MRQEHCEFCKGGTSNLQWNSGWPLRAPGCCQAEEARVIAVLLLLDRYKTRSVLPGFTSSAAVPHKCHWIAIIHFCSCCLGGCGHSIYLPFFFLPFSSFFHLLFPKYINIKPKWFHVMQIFFRNAVLQMTIFSPPSGTFHTCFLHFVLWRKGSHIATSDFYKI